NPVSPCSHLSRIESFDRRGILTGIDDVMNNQGVGRSIVGATQSEANLRHNPLKNGYQDI
ncbi:hypothetical protein TNCT_69901, partial [Trichonephila clavata]